MELGADPPVLKSLPCIAAFEVINREDSRRWVFIAPVLPNWLGRGMNARLLQEAARDPSLSLFLLSFRDNDSAAFRGNRYFIILHHMIYITKNHWFQIVVLSLLLSSICQAQSGDKADSETPKDGRFLFDLTYTNTDSFEGDVEVLSPGFTWLVRPDLRVSMATTFVRFKPDSGPKLNPREGETSHGLGDTLFTMQYDWAARLTASPWIPDDLGMSLSVLAPTGEAERFLGTDSWQASLSMSWPVEIEGGWLLNPVISYNFSFNEGPLAQPLNVVETGIGIIKVFPSKFWIAYTPSLWFDFDADSWNFDDHLTVGKMFSNGVGLSLDFGRLARHSRVLAEDDRSLLLNFYFQFGH